METIARRTEIVESSIAGPPLPREASSSGVSWGAVIGGAFVAAAFYLILLDLGAGFGLASVSPWSNIGASASTVGTMGLVWLIFIEIIASGLGGYLTGRLRTKWTAVHTDEVYFRDTANGFLSWAVALVISVTFLATAATSMVGNIVEARSAQEPTTRTSGPSVYFVDKLFRSERTAGAVDPATQAEAARIFDNALQRSDTPTADQAYLGQMVASRTGMSQPSADRRVSDVITEARQTLDVARKATARVLLWMFLALLIGAFCASYAATIGGRQRDHAKVA